MFHLVRLYSILYAGWILLGKILSVKEKLVILVYLIFFLLQIKNAITTPNLQKSLHMIRLKLPKIPTAILDNAFKRHPDVKELYMDDNSIDEISKGDFPKSAAQLTFLSLKRNRLVRIEEGAFEDMVNLVEIDIGGNYLRRLPKLGAANLKSLNLTMNNIEKIGKYALKSYKKLETLVLSNNPLKLISEGALLGPDKLQFLYLQSTQLTSLPNAGLESLVHIDTQNIPLLHELPSAERFKMLSVAKFSYSMQCCAFMKYQKIQGARLSKKSKIFYDQSDSLQINFNDSKSLSMNTEKTERSNFSCFPEPTVLNPCDNILGSDVLRALTWLISSLAIMMNILKISIICCNNHQLLASKLLLFNLGLSNLITGGYLFGVSCADASTYGAYYTHVSHWQYGGGCQAFGFIILFSVNLSMCCLILLAIERFLLTNYPTHIGENQASHSVHYLIAAWIYSFTIAILPATKLVGSFINNAVCLPLDVHTTSAKAFVSWLLFSFIIAFVVIFFCFAQVLRKSVDSEAAHDSQTQIIRVRIAKRVLIISSGSFACWLPISIIGFAVLYSTYEFNALILKFMLLLFFPFPSILTPILYIVLNKSFRKDTWVLIRKCGIRRCYNDKKLEKVSQGSRGVEKGNNQDALFHIDTPNDSINNSFFQKQALTVNIPEEDDGCNAPHDTLPCIGKDSIQSKAHCEDKQKENPYTFPSTFADENEMRRQRAASTNFDNITSKRSSDPRFRSDTTGTCSTGVSATSDVELLEL